MNRLSMRLLLTILLLLVGVVLLYQPRYHLLHGVAFACLLIGAPILLTLSIRASLALGVVTCVAGIVFLFWPAQTLLRGSATSLLLMGSLLLPAACLWKRPVGWVGLAVMLIGGIALYGAMGQGMQERALVLLLAGTLAFSIALPDIRWVERSALGLIVAGLAFLCQPFVLALYQSGFQVLIAGTTAFIVVSHRV